MRITGVEAAIAHYREAGTKKNAHNRNCAQMGSAELGVLLYIYINESEYKYIHVVIDSYNLNTKIVYALKVNLIVYALKVIF